MDLDLIKDPEKIINFAIGSKFTKYSSANCDFKILTTDNTLVKGGLSTVTQIKMNNLVCALKNQQITLYSHNILRDLWYDLKTINPSDNNIMYPDYIMYKVPNLLLECIILLWIRQSSIYIDNFVLMYNFFFDYKIESANIVMEWIDGGIEDFFKIISKPYDSDDHLNMLIQLFCTVYSLGKIGISHNDLHYKNIMIKKISSNIELKYIIDHQLIIVPNRGFMIKIIDFGSSELFTISTIIPPVHLVPYRNLIGKKYYIPTELWDILTIYLSLICQTNSKYNIINSHPEFYSDQIKKFNQEMCTQFLDPVIQTKNRSTHLPSKTEIELVSESEIPLSSVYIVRWLINYKKLYC